MSEEKTQPEFDDVMNVYKRLTGKAKEAADAYLNSGNYEPKQLQTLLEPLKSASPSQLDGIIKKFGKKKNPHSKTHDSGSSNAPRTPPNTQYTGLAGIVGATACAIGIAASAPALAAVGGLGALAAFASQYRNSHYKAA
ncbi:MAG TPA: hypothetical protein VJI52_05565 [Candidatus Nanoarchaeia archaeon]|nr:hypothetical protein [Candidatus Nanoarchaeia archaeon]